MPQGEEHITHPDPVVHHQGVIAATSAVGFWNNVPLEEQRAPGPQVVVVPKDRPASKVPGLLDAPAAEMGFMLFLTMMAIVLERVAILWVTMNR